MIIFVVLNLLIMFFIFRCTLGYILGNPKYFKSAALCSEILNVQNLFIQLNEIERK